MSPLNVLLLSHVKPGFANTCFDHQDALSVLSSNRVVVLSPLECSETAPDLDLFDVVVIHYSIICFSHTYLPPIYRRALQDFVGLKVIFIQDEYRFVNDAVSAMTELGVDVLFTCVPPAAVEPLYGPLRRRGVRIEHTLTGFVPDSLVGQPFLPLQDRPLHAVYRGRPLPFSLGSLATEKIEIARLFGELGPQYGLKIDVDWREESRIYGPDWNRFLSSGVCALGTESGASICDMTGDIDRAVRLYMQENPDADFAEVTRAILVPYEGNVVINTISPRAFEAISLGTALVQFPGEYSGVLEAGRHYIPLAKDFSNMDEVAAAIQDIPRLEAMVVATYEDVIGSGRYSYTAFASQVDGVIAEEWQRRVYRDPVQVPQFLIQRDGTASVANKPANLDELSCGTARSLLPPPDNFATAEAGARIVADSGFFERPHDGDYLLRHPCPDGYAAAIAQTGRPQWVEVDLGQSREVWSVEVEWFSDENMAQTFAIEVRVTSDSPWLLLASVSNSTAARWRADADGTAIRYLRLTAWTFFGQQRLLVRSLRILGRDPATKRDAAKDRSHVRLNLLQERAGVQVIGSSPLFGTPHDATALLGDEIVQGRYTAGIEGAALPHWIAFDLGAECLVDAVWMAWLSQDSRCQAFRLLGRVDPARPWQELTSRSQETDSISLVEFPRPTAIRQIRLEASSFHGQQRLLARSIWVLGAKTASG